MALRGGGCAAEQRGRERLGLGGGGTGAVETVRRPSPRGTPSRLPPSPRAGVTCHSSRKMVARSGRGFAPQEDPGRITAATRAVRPIVSADPPRHSCACAALRPRAAGDGSGSARLSRGRCAVAPLVVIRRDRRVVGVKYGKAERTRAAGDAGGGGFAPLPARGPGLPAVWAAGCGRRRLRVGELAECLVSARPLCGSRSSS